MRRALIVSLLFASCGYGPPLSLACQDVAQARCALRESCTDGASIIAVYGDMQTCLAREALSCTLGGQAPDISNTPSSVEECAVAYGGFACADFLAGQVPAPCAVPGPRAMGAPCAFFNQCASGYCGGTKTAACGTCAPPPIAGAPCVDSQCARGSQCVSRTLTCEDVPAEGMPCDQNAIPCAADLACIATSGTQSTCTTTSATVGAPCGGSLGACDATRGVACEGIASATRTCRRVVFAADRKPCGALTNGNAVACAAGACYTATGIARVGDLGACKADAADGEPCDPVLGPGCVQPARCEVPSGATTGACTLPAAPSCG